MGEADVVTLERGYAALNRGDLSVVLELLDPDIEWHEPGWSPEAGTHRGRDSFERFLRGWLESFEQFRIEPERVVQRGDQLVAVVRQTGAGRSSGVQVETRLARSPTARPFAGKGSRSPRRCWAMSVSDRTDLARHALEQLCSGSDPPPPSASTAIEDPSRGGGGVRLRHLERRDQPLARQARCVRRAARALRPGGRLALSDIVSGTQLPEGVTCDASLWAACIGGAMQRDRYREAIEAAGLQITAWCENEQYRFVSERADNAVRKYGFKSISLLARRGDRTA